MSVALSPYCLGERDSRLDALRGVAVLLMVADHLILVLEAEPLLRWGPTRVAMPIFMLLAGQLVRRFSLRLAWVALIGLALPWFIPWTERPSILLLYAVGASVVLVLRRVSWVGGLVVLAACLSALANGLDGPGYAALAVVGLVVLGSMMPRSWFSDLGGHCPGWCAPFGRFPLSVYVGHLALLRAWEVWL